MYRIQLDVHLVQAGLKLDLHLAALIYPKVNIYYAIGSH